MSEAPKDRREMSLKEKLGLAEASEPPWSLASAALTVGAMFVCLAIIGPGLVAALAGGGFLSPIDLMLSWAIGMALTSLFVLVARRSSEASWRALRLTGGELPLALALLVGVAIALTVDLIVSLASGEFLPPPQIWGYQSRGAPGLFLAGMVAVALQPLAETLIFQGVLLPRLRWSLGPWRGLMGASALFTLLHMLVYGAAYPMYDSIWHSVVFPLAIGILFCLLKVYTKSTAAVLAARMGAGLIFLLTALAIFGG